MAYFDRKYCCKCQKETGHVNGNCSECYEKQVREEMAAWQAQTIEEKLLDIHKRLLSLENSFIRF